MRYTGNQTLAIENEVIKRTKELELTSLKIAKLAIVVQQTHEIVIITDSKGIIEYVNPAFEEISGYSYDEAVGSKPSILKSGHHPDSFYGAMWDQLNSGESWCADFTNRNRKGDVYQVSQSITPIVGSNDETIGFVSVQSDVTNQREMERKLQHTDRVESLGVLAGGIAHDFNNLLTAILGNSSLAMKKLDATSPVIKHIDAIERASNSAAGLCKQMLAYSGKGAFVLEPVILTELVDNMSKLIDVSLTKNVDLKYSLSPLMPTIEADVTQIQQVILNLITNASESIDGKDGKVTITTGIVNIDLNYLSSCIQTEAIPGIYVYLEVSDTGCGMDDITQKKIFDPFFTTKFAGRGLGMSAMLGIVKGHQGTMRIYSEVGKGTTIKVAFPASDKGVATIIDQPISSSTTPMATGTILIIDDEEVIREIATVLLEELGFNVITANDGIEGIEEFQKHKESISLILLDLTMPKMDGGACFSELRRIDPNVRVLLSSGYNELDISNHFVEEGLAGFIQKPYSVESFAQKVQEALNK